MTTIGKTRVLVTGATGFVGSHTLRALQERTDVRIIAACRTPGRLDPGFVGEIRSGDLRDAAYRQAVVRDVDVICHVGTWGSFWGHEVQEREYFFQPTLDLMEQAIQAGVRRFILANTVAIGTPGNGKAPLDDFSPTRRTGFWPHLDRLIDLDAWMQANAGRGMGMVTMRLGHFVGARNEMGLVAALASRLRTRMVPWLAGGKSRLPLIADTDLGAAFAAAATAHDLALYESFNICGPEFPTAREVISLIAAASGSPTPMFSVPYAAGHAFGWLMERLHPLLPGKAPFLTRSLVHVARDWWCPGDYARDRLGYFPRKNWRVAVREALAVQERAGYPWPYLAQAA